MNAAGSSGAAPAAISRHSRDQGAIALPPLRANALGVVGVSLSLSGVACAESNPAEAAVPATANVRTMDLHEVEMLDVQGRSVATLARGQWRAGHHAVSWSTRRLHAPGVYFVRYRYPGGSAIRRLVRN